ncbi:uncharacterized protein STEHIDRAFT_141728 [Stereum hirsutum FP-91666 SS1]|uniref:uncharacterized protein n=1 Tax=Stereum hirsutum (strain FP-91666) TaxID=721885 RepID=UPI0004449738|nr:uncharacterized protein STEHIDRAFT_141728 [Stereum hirsutum FP-91666 SS1]EIM82435.1 hypothetical protein STEHIDRAFT_141728 [Stereum hirsutum FP-91666 SS1]
MAAPAQEETGDVGPSEAQFAAIMLDAKTRYKSETNVTIDDLKDVPLDIDELMEEITKRQDRFAAFRKKGKSIRNALKPFLEIINQISDGAGEGLSLVPSPDAGIAKPILKAISFLITAAKDVEKSYDYIVDLFDNLNNMLERYKIYVSHDVPIPIRTNMVKTLAHMLVIFGNATKAIKTGRGLQFIKVLIGQNGAVAKSLEKLENLIKQEHSLVSATILSISTDIFGEVANQKGDSSGLDVEGKKTVRQILIRICDAAEKFGDNSSTVEDIRSAVIRYSDELQTVKNAQTRQTLIAWLDAPDMPQNHKQARDRHTKDTGVWLLDSSQFKEWKDGTVSTLYLMGKPGCGKSVLCSTIINRLRYTVIREGQSSAALAYHYFDFRHPAQQSCESLLLSLCRQLLDYSPGIPAALERLHQKTLGRKDFSLDELQSTFHDMLPSFEHVYIVVDALDECASDLESGRVTQFLKSLLESAMSGVHIVLTSRPTGSIHNAIAEDVSRGHRIDLGINVGVHRDIARYIKSSLYGDNAHTRFKVLHRTDRATIEKKLVHDADGMFRWAFCQLEALQKCGTPAKLLEALKTLPRTLDETYERTLMAIPEDDRAYAKRILLWLAFSLRPLTMNEAAETMTLTLHFDDMSQKPHFSDQERPFSSSYVLETCSSLVDKRVDYQNGIHVQLAHASVKEYLIQSRIRDSYFFLDADLAHEILAHACLSYMQPLIG